MKGKIALLALTLGSLYCTAQDGYPKQILLEGDSVVVFTHEQVVLINFNKLSYDECRQEVQSYIREIELKSKALDLSREAEMETVRIKEQARQIDKEQQNQITLLEDNNKSLERKVRLNKSMRYVIGGIGLTVGTYVGNKLSAFISF